MIKPTINIGPVTFHLYGLIIAISISLGWLLAKKRAKYYKVNEKIFDDPILLIPLILAIVGARLYHVVDYWNYYSINPKAILLISSGGLGIWGALFGAILGFIIVARARHLNILAALDLVSPSLLLGQALGRIGNYINQEAFGPPTNQPWGIFIDQAHRPAQYSQFSNFHPTFFYEAIIDGIFLFVLLVISPKLKRGQTFSLYLILYAIGRFIVEFWRIDTWVVGSIKIAHLLAVLTIILGIWLFIKFQRVDTL